MLLYVKLLIVTSDRYFIVWYTREVSPHNVCALLLVLLLISNISLVAFEHLHIGCPTILRCDYGTENISLATIQIAFRMNGDDSFGGQKSFMFGLSTANIVSL